MKAFFLLSCFIFLSTSPFSALLPLSYFDNHHERSYNKSVRHCGRREFLKEGRLC
jgi:hypothetical protein